MLRCQIFLQSLKTRPQLCVVEINVERTLNFKLCLIRFRCELAKLELLGRTFVKFDARIGALCVPEVFSFQCQGRPLADP
jgi:hypothetical protein